MFSRKDKALKIDPTHAIAQINKNILLGEQKKKKASSDDNNNRCS
jgi:hypothetical protein